MIWRTGKLGEFSKITNGNSIPLKIKEKKFTGIKGMPYIATKDISFEGDVNYENGVSISDDELKNFKIAPKESILICAEGGSAGKKIAFIDRNCCFVNKLFSINSSSEISSKFIFYYLKSAEFQSQFNNSLTGLIGGVSLSKIKNFQITFPESLEMQEEIVEKLDLVFYKIDNEIERNKIRLKEIYSLKSSSLNKLVSENYSSQIYKLGEICNLIGGGTPSKNNKEFYGGDIPWATVRDMSSDYLSTTDFKITKLGLTKSSANIILKNNLVIASRVGLGKVCILNQDTAINQDLKGVIPKNNYKIDNLYLFYWFKANERKIISAGRGATVQGVTLTFLNSLQVPLPDLEIQKKISGKLDFVMKKLDLTINTIKKINENFYSLKSSLIKQYIQS